MTILCVKPFSLSFHLSRHQGAQVCSLLLVWTQSPCLYCKGLKKRPSLVRPCTKILTLFLLRVSRKYFFFLWVWRKGTRFFNRWWVSFLDILLLVRYNFNDIPSPQKVVVLINKTCSSSIFSILRAIINSHFPFCLMWQLWNYSGFFLLRFTTL